MPDNDLKYWLALSFIKDIGPVTIKRLLSAFHSPQDIMKASFNELKDVEDVGKARAKRIKEFNAWDLIDTEIKKAEKHNINIITYSDKEYPEHLKQIIDAPTVLYTKGRFTKDDRYAIAIVGSRLMTEYGKRTAEKMAGEIASCGLTVVSGMARGIDTVSHENALKTGGRSIAVLGCGMDKPYPPENRKLFGALSQSGCVVSEFPIGTPPNKENFPKRNRLISGLSMGVLVIEATRESGSLITASYALEQGKEVFAIPGNLTSANSEGTNALIKKGAKLVQKIEDILEELSPQLKGLLKIRENSLTRSMDGLEINEEEKAICNILGTEPKHIDIIAREIKMPSSRLSGLLLGLEIKGIVKQTEGKRFYIL
ncbi:MAG: DNA-processing protein DprA [Thermodesulfovibrionales bacterium]|nr:DNA-processing protein DprA [Thermodesulfovibrionales bacterium]